ncbi:glycosyltransferase [Alteromonas macleodii]|uniref:Glycosyltransferase, family GT2 n=1 Tax=Alteromonas macleodii TaxID=28108 RepID=A0A6T9XZT7_ALTMA|nr:glycosyltransferase [Alteromonas macleodii]CAB9493548.1 Glycosyltransferase, family GT2 [Alteromonas macleodii]
MESTSPLISVIIPAFNAELYIKEALESVCSQTYVNLEIIIIDDGSSDRTREIIEKFQDARIRLISRENRGLIATLNEGIEISRGDYIARMDADDICLSTRLETQVEYLRKHNNIGLLFTGIEYIDENGRKLREKVSTKSRKLEPVELLFGCPVCHPTVMFDMTKLKKSDIQYDKAYCLAEDFELWTRLVSITEIGIINRVLFKYRIHPNSITSKNNEKQRIVATRAVKENMIMSHQFSDNQHFFTIYNNHLGDESKFQTLHSLAFVALNLKKLNKKFNYRKYFSKSYYLFRDKIRKKNKKLIRG